MSLSSSSLSSSLSEAPSIVHRLVDRAVRHRERTALTFRTGPGRVDDLSYGDLVARSAAMAERLRATRPSPGGERFALIALPNEIDYVVAFYACGMAGVTAITFLTPSMYTSRAAAAFSVRLRHVLIDCDPGTVICHEELVRWLREDSEHAGALDGRLVVLPEQVEASAEAAIGDPDVQGADLALLQYTSGSTSEPKGVMVTHANLAHNVEVIARSFGSVEGESMTGWLPLYHDMGLIGVVLQSIWSGMSVHLMSPQAFIRRPAFWLQTISATRSAQTVAPNFGYDLVTRRASDSDLDGVDLSCLRHAMNGAEPVRASTIDRFAKRFGPYHFDTAAMMPVYGLAENTVAVSLSYTRREPSVIPLDPRRLSRDGVAVRAAGHPAIDTVGCGDGSAHGISVRIVDITSFRPCPVGTVGEIWVSGASVAKGYWGRPMESEETFGARVVGEDTRYLRTGDLGALLDGTLVIVGRVKDIIVHNGMNHYPQDLEHTAERSHAALRPGAGVAFSMLEQDKERVVLVQELDCFDSTVNRYEVLGAIRQAVAEVHGLQLDCIVLVGKGQVPKTTSGKVQRRATRQRFVDGGFTPMAEWHSRAQPATTSEGRDE